MAAVSFRDISVPDGPQLCRLQPVQVGGGIGVVPEHVGTEVWGGAGPLPGSDDGQEITARSKPAADARKQCPLVRERNMNQGVEGRYGVCACWPQLQASHVGLHEAGCGDKAPGPVKLDGGEINAEDLQPVAGQLTGCRYPGPAAEVDNPGSGAQQASQFRHPAGVAADVLCGGSGRVAVITAVGQRNRVITAADKGTLPRPLSHTIGIH